MYLPFIPVSSIMASSYLISQYSSVNCSTVFLKSGHQPIMYLFSICNSASSSVAAFIFSVDLHIGTSTDMLILCMLAIMPGSSWSWFSMWFGVAANLL